MVGRNAGILITLTQTTPLSQALGAWDGGPGEMPVRNTKHTDFNLPVVLTIITAYPDPNSLAN